MDRGRESFFEIERLQRLLVDGEARVVRQEGLIAGMKLQGLDTAEAEELLASFKDTLDAMHQCMRVRFERTQGIEPCQDRLEPAGAVAPPSGNPVPRP